MKSQRMKQFWIGVLFLLPISLVMIVFLVSPIFRTIFYSMTDWNGISAFHWTGLKNYADIFRDSSFIASIRRTLFIGFSIALFTNIFGLLLAVIVDQALLTRNVIRSLFFIPMLFPVVVAAYVWKYILDANNGLINRVFSDVSGASVHIPWIDTPANVVWVVIFVSVWQLVGPVMVVYLAALQTVPHEMKEAGIIDGASPLKQFYKITLPMIAPGVTINALIGLANGLRLFDLPYALTGGGPANATETLAIRIYRNAFQAFNLGYGMAGAIILTLFTLVITLVFVSFTKKYEGKVYS